MPSCMLFHNNFQPIYKKCRNTEVQYLVRILLYELEKPVKNIKSPEEFVIACDYKMAFEVRRWH